MNGLAGLAIMAIVIMTEHGVADSKAAWAEMFTVLQVLAAIIVATVGNGTGVVRIAYKSK
jgi:hypothetical protein